MRLYEKYSEEKLKIAERIQRLRYQVLIHSCLYYKMNTNIVDDVQYDKWARELEALQNANPAIAQDVDYADAFNGFSASTGFDLPLDDPWVHRKAVWLSCRPVNHAATASDTPRRVVQEGKLAVKTETKPGQVRKLFSI